MISCSFRKYTLHFKKPGGTSRGTLYDKDTYILTLSDGVKKAYGECNLFKGLSYDDRPDYEQKLKEVCARLPVEKENVLENLSEWPSIHFGVETVLRDWKNGCRQIIFPEGIAEEGFTIPANGLIWMGTYEEMKSQIATKLDEGYVSIKLKVGAIDFGTELDLLKYIRKQFTAEEVEIRLDANGAFKVTEAEEKLKRISAYDVHYIEQPIKAGQWHEMAHIVENSPVKIALDEELIGIINPEEKVKLMETISPDLLILKPALIGGFEGSEDWKRRIESHGGDWVITSALESNIGLNAIAQYTALDMPKIAQGLGTGKLFTNNFSSPYTVDSKGLHYHCNKIWDFSLLT